MKSQNKEQSLVVEQPAPPQGNLVKALSGMVTEFNPREVAERAAKLEGWKAYAEAVRDWELLSQAVDQQISDQRNFVAWWDANVGVRQHLKADNADRRCQLSLDVAEKETKFTQQQVSKFRKRLQDILAYREFLRGPSYRKAMGGRGSTDQRGASGTGENEWYTPAQYIESAREVLGEIDLDPASSDSAQKAVRANSILQSWINASFRWAKSAILILVSA